MRSLILAVHRAVMEHYNHAWDVPYVKFTIRFDMRGHIIAITYTPIPEEHEDEVLERVRQACQPHGEQFRGKLESK